MELIEKAPRIRPYKFERPEIECWDSTSGVGSSRRQLGRASGLLVATLLAGDAGLRLGEALGLRWEDLDLVADGRMVAAESGRAWRELRRGDGEEASLSTGALAAALKACRRCG